MKKIIVDGYNLIHAIPAIRNKLGYDLETARNDLINLLVRFRIKKKTYITVVFDGKSGSLEEREEKKNIEVCFSHAPEKADQVIKRMIDKVEGEKGIMVVSSDREIFDYAKVCGLQRIKSEKFAAMLLSTPEKKSKKKKKNSDSKMSKDELQEWMRLFESK